MIPPYGPLWCSDGLAGKGHWHSARRRACYDTKVMLCVALANEAFVRPLFPAGVRFQHHPGLRGQWAICWSPPVPLLMLAALERAPKSRSRRVRVGPELWRERGFCKDGIDIAPCQVVGPRYDALSQPGPCQSGIKFDRGESAHPDGTDAHAWTMLDLSSEP